jgi:hypothetical protein
MALCRCLEILTLEVGNCVRTHNSGVNPFTTRPARPLDFLNMDSVIKKKEFKDKDSVISLHLWYIVQKGISYCFILVSLFVIINLYVWISDNLIPPSHIHTLSESCAIEIGPDYSGLKGMYDSCVRKNQIHNWPLWWMDVDDCLMYGGMPQT